MARWENPPDARVFRRELVECADPVAGEYYADFHSSVRDLDWPSYRAGVLGMDSAREERRVRDRLGQIEEYFGFEVPGELLLCSAFMEMDGFARFDRGT